MKIVEKRFFCCQIKNCNNVFESDELRDVSNDILCEACKEKLYAYHIVQCSVCESIIEFVEAESYAIQKILYTDNCHICKASLKKRKYEHKTFMKQSYI